MKKKMNEGKRKKKKEMNEGKKKINKIKGK